MLCLLCGCFSNPILAVSSSEQLVICAGQAFGKQWNTQVDLFIQEIFAVTELTPKVFHAPTKRAEQLFKNGTCGGFFASSKDFPQALDRIDIIQIPENIFRVKVEVFLSPQTLCITENNCMKDLLNSDIVGLFRSHQLVEFLPSITKASIVEVVSMEQGFNMLDKHRIKALVVPVVNINMNNLLIKYYNMVSVETITEIDLYIWLDERYRPYLKELNNRLKTLKSNEKWQGLFLSKQN